jgi:hypothetical protein
MPAFSRDGEALRAVGLRLDQDFLGAGNLEGV